MADGRELEVWETYASQCKEANRTPIVINKDNWFAQKLNQLNNIKNVVDIGCGPGNWAALFSNYNYIAFDQSPSMLALVKEYVPTAQTKLGNARELGKHFEPESIDMCFSSAVLQHNRHTPDKEDIVKGIYKILRPGGYYMCTENTFDHWDPNFTDGYSLTLNGWEHFMNDFEFELLEHKQLVLPYEIATPTALYLFKKSN